jgi:hypothetical protein
LNTVTKLNGKIETLHSSKLELTSELEKVNAGHVNLQMDRNRIDEELTKVSRELTLVVHENITNKQKLNDLTKRVQDQNTGSNSQQNLNTNATQGTQSTPIDMSSSNNDADNRRSVPKRSREESSSSNFHRHRNITRPYPNNQTGGSYRYFPNSGRTDGHGSGLPNPSNPQRGSSSSSSHSNSSSSSSHSHGESSNSRSNSGQGTHSRGYGGPNFGASGPFDARGTQICLKWLANNCHRLAGKCRYSHQPAVDRRGDQLVREFQESKHRLDQHTANTSRTTTIEPAASRISNPRTSSEKNDDDQDVAEDPDEPEARSPSTPVSPTYSPKSDDSKD